MNESKQITTFQCIAIIINSTIGLSVLVLPRIASEKVGSGAFLVTCIGMIFPIISLYIIALLSKRFPSESIIQYGQKLISKPLGKIFGFILIIYFFTITALVLREFGEVMNTTLLQETPMSATLIVMLIAVAVATRNNLTTIAYMQSFYLPFIVIPILLMVIFAIQDIDPRHMKPFLGNDTTIIDFLSSGLAVAGLPFIHIGMYIILIFASHMIDTKRILKGSMWGIGISAFIILLSTGVTVAVFGSEEIDNSLWPMLVLTRMTELPFAILERLDILFLVVWIISAFTTILSGYLLGIEFSSQLFKLRSHRVLSYLLLPFVFVLSLYPHNILHLYNIMEVVGRWGTLLAMGYPIILLLVSLIRKKGGKHS
ncbi:spore germination protein A2 [Lysinibacillus sp. PLM2]|nr:spore germination protein A2 [Lysinibacillus sp. PLM2]